MQPDDRDDAAETVVVHDDETRVSSSPTPVVERSLPELVGAMVGRYRVTGLLGQGAMGIVLQAEDESLGRAVAIKLIHERVELESRGRQRLEREARTLAALSHPNVVHVYEIGSHHGRLFVAMERVGGRSLRAWLREQSRPWSERLALLCAAGDGLAAAHRAGIVHRDFKPDNVLVDDDGRPRVLDFGLAVPAGSHDTGAVALPPVGLAVGLAAGMVDSGTLTATGTIMGTPAYMAPEQYLGAAPDARSDQFSFCVALFEALWGRRPFGGDDFDALREAILAGRIDDARPPRELPRAVVAAVRRGLSREPQARFESMAALLATLRAAVRPRRRGAIAAAALGLAGAAALAAWQPWRSPVPATPAAAEPALPAAAPTPAVEPWRVSLRPLTKTPPPGIEGAAIDPAGREILYTLGDSALRRPLEGGTPVPLPLPGDATPWFVGYDRGGAPLAVVDGALWRFGEGEAPVALLREMPSFEYLEISPDGARIAALGDLQLTWWTMPAGTRTSVALPGERPAGLAWSRDGALLAARSWPVGSSDETLRVFDRDGRELSRTHLPASDVEGLAWLGDRTLVLAAGESDALQLQCLSWSPQTRSFETLARSEPLPLPWAQSYLVGITDDHRGLFTVVREIEDVATGRVGHRESWSTLAPSRDAGNSSAAWLGRDRIAMWSDRDLQPTIVLDDLAGHTTLAPLATLGRPRQVAVTADGTMVVTLARSDEAPSRLAVLPAGASAFAVLPEREALAAALVDLRCDGIDAPRGCIGLLERDERRSFVRFDADADAGAAVLREAACPEDHLCLYGAFAPTDAGAAVLLPTADYRHIDRIALDGGAVAPSGVEPPPGYDATGAAPLPGRKGEVVVTLTANTAARGDVPTYVVAVVAPGRASRTLWSSASTYSTRPIVAPGGQRVAVDASVFHEEAMLLEGLSSCAQRAAAVPATP